jgi:hypothetical protein
MEPFESRRRVVFPPRLLVGLAFVAAGALLALDRFTALDVGPLWRYWPLFLIAIGLSKLTQPGGGRGAGLILVGVGTGFLGTNLHWWHLSFNDLFPFLIIALGVLMIGRAFLGPAWHRRGFGETADGNARIDAFAMMGLVRRISDSADFRGGSANAIMGACEIDLRRATLAPEGAMLDCFALWGGIQVAVPESWTVAIEGTPIMGAFEDHRVVQAATGPAQRLVIRGVALMGGVEIRNRFERD